MRDFRKYEIWKEGMKMVKEIYRFSVELPDNERYGLRSQITRAAVSIPSNIAEGCSRKSGKDFGRFLEIALGSAFELETQLLIVNDLEFCDSSSCFEIIEHLHLIQRQINSLIQKLK